MSAKLAIHGGKPIFPEGPPAWPPADERISEVLGRLAADGSWGRYHGPHCAELRERIAGYLHLKHVRLYSSGTIAVEAALRAAGVVAGDRVLLAGYDFPGNFRAIEAVGARPVLVDPDLHNWSFDPDCLPVTQRWRPKAAIVSHLHGGLAPMARIRNDADRLGIAIVEDACQATGAMIDGRRAGAWGHVGVWSFGGSKLLTGGRGGALFTDDDTIAQRAKLFSERGNDAFPLSEMQAAVLVPQLEQLDVRNLRRNAAVQRLLRQIADLEWMHPVAVADSQHAFYKLAFRLTCATGSRDDLVNDLTFAARAEGLALDAGFRGFERRGDRRCDQGDNLTTARQLACSTLLLHHPILLGDEPTLNRVAMAIRKLAQLVRPGP